jgi:probable blue pigment (indigoidine) exporter
MKAPAETETEANIVLPPADIQPRWAVVCAYLLCAFIWGTTWYGIRVCIAPGGYSPFPAAALRFTISVILLATIWAVRHNRIHLRDFSQLKWVAFAGVLSGIGYGVLYAAEQRISGGLAAVIGAMGPLVAALIAAATKTERLSRATVFGCITALLGVAVVFHDRLRVSPDQAVLVAILLLNVSFSSGSNVVMKRFGRDVPAVASNAVFFLGAASLL